MFFFPNGLCNRNIEVVQCVLKIYNHDNPMGRGQALSGIFVIITIVEPIIMLFSMRHALYELQYLNV